LSTKQATLSTGFFLGNCFIDAKKDEEKKPYCLVLVGYRNGFARDFTIKLK